MKNYFIKIFIILLIITILPAISSLCSFNLSNSLIKINTAQATSTDITINHDCSEQNINQKNNSTNITKNHNFILPCCLNASSNTTPAISLSFELDKFTPLLIATSTEFITTSLKTSSYTILIVSPPKLSLIKTTILRL